MTTIDPAEDDEEDLEEALLEKKRSETKWGDKVESDE